MPKRTPVIAITGAQGFIGRQIVEHFADQGWEVRALARHPATISEPHITYYRYDLTGRLNPQALIGVDYLIHAAYIKHDHKHPDALKLNYDGTAKLLAAARKHHIKRTIFISSLSARADAVSHYGQQKYAIEQLFNTPDDTIIRPGLVVGPGGLVKETADFMQTKHIIPLVGGGQQPVQIIGIGELVTAIDTILTSDIGGTFTLASSRVYPYREFYKIIAQHVHAKVIFIPLPFAVMRALIRLANALRIPLAITEDNLLGLQQMERLTTAADLRRLNLTIRPLKTTLKKAAL